MMAFPYGDPGDDETEIDEQPTIPIPAALAAFDPEELVNTRPHMTPIDLIVAKARARYLLEEMNKQSFCPVCLRFDGVEEQMEPRELTERLRPILCQKHLELFIEASPAERVLLHVLIRQAIQWYLWPPDFYDHG